MRTRSFAAVFLCACFVSLGAAQNPAAVTTGPASPYGASEYRLGPEDVLQLYVYKECPDLCVDNVVIRPDGIVALPLVGELTATGKTPLQLQKEVVEKLSAYFSEPHVNVIVKQVNSAKVSVLGEVNKPGMFPIGTRTTLLDAIALGGGFTPYAKKDKIVVVRSAGDGTKTKFELSVDRLIKSKNDVFYVLPYDTIYVN
jgi:polysaccharide export outer membrane protein